MSTQKKNGCRIQAIVTPEIDFLIDEAAGRSQIKKGEFLVYAVINLIKDCGFDVTKYVQD